MRPLTWERRALDRIEETLHAGDPRLSSLFVIFARLTLHEAMPLTEQISVGLWKSLHVKIAIPITLIGIAGVVMLSWLSPAWHECGVSTIALSHSQSSGQVSACRYGPALGHTRVPLK
jgi:hypothetical protein